MRAASSSGALRLVHVSDLHLGRAFGRLAGPDVEEVRRGDFLRNFELAVDVALRSKASLLLISGDSFDRPNPAPRDLVSFSRVVGKATGAGVHVVCIAGNHDKPKVAHAQSPLQALVEAHAPYFHFYQSVPSEPLVLNVDGLRVAIVAVPYVDLGVARALSVSLGHLVKGEIERQLSGPQAGDADVVLLLAHLVAANAALDLEEQYLIQEPRVGLSDLKDAAFDYLALGHVHKPQQVGRRAYYAGSVERLSFREHLDGKSFNVVDIDKSGAVNVEAVPCKCRDMVVKSLYLEGSKDPVSVITNAMLKEGIKEGSLLKLELCGDDASLAHLDKNFMQLSSYLLNQLKVAGYCVEKRTRSPAPCASSLRVKELTPERIAEKAREYIDRISSEPSVRERAKQLVVNLVKEVEEQ